MSADSLLQLLLRSLPSALLIVLGILAAADVKTRRQWTNFLYSVGSLRANQRDDEKKQASVKWPFFILAVALLWLPIRYIKSGMPSHEVGKDAGAFTKAADDAEEAAAKTIVVKKATPTGPTPPPAPLRPGQAAPAAAAPLAPAAAPIAPTAKPATPSGGTSGPHL